MLPIQTTRKDHFQMELFNQIEACKALVDSTIKLPSGCEYVVDQIKRSALSNWVKYYGYKHLLAVTDNQAENPANQAIVSLLEQRRSGPALEKEAHESFVQINALFGDIPRNRNNDKAFTQLLTLFLEYYADTPAAQDANSLSEHINRSWVSLVFELCQSMFSYAVKHPVQTTFVILIAITGVASAKQPKKVISSGVTTHPPNVDNHYGLSVSAQELLVSVQLSNNELIGLAREKLKIDYVSGANEKSCEHIPKSIASTVKQFPHSYDRIQRVLQHPEFTLTCASAKSMGCYKGSGSEGGEYRPYSKTIALPAASTKSSWKTAAEKSLALINHEFMHADSSLLHQNDRCSSRTWEEAVAPVYPYNTNTLRAYHRAFDVGDKRIKEFQDLVKRKNSGAKLNKFQQSKLQRYTKACRGCYKTWGESALSNAQYNQLKNIDLQRVEVEGADSSGALIRIVRVKKQKGQQPIGRYTFRSSIDVVLMLPKLMEDMVHKKYKDAHEGIRIAERETHTFQFLTELAIETFYPEAYQLHKEYIAKCLDEAPAQVSPKLM